MNKNQLFKMIKKMTPGDVMQFVSQELEMNPAEFLTKNAGSIALKAVKSGWAKAGNIKDAVKGFSDKTKKDDTGINWDEVEVEEAGFKMKCLFDGDSGKKLKEFVKNLGDQMKDFAEDEKKVNEVELLNESKINDVVSRKAIDAIIDAAKNGGKVSKPDGGYVIQSGETLARNILKTKFPDDYKKLQKLVGASRHGVLARLDIIAYAAKTGDESKIENALKNTGVVSLKDTAKAITKNAAEKTVDKALSGAKNLKQMQQAFDGLDSNVKKEIEDLMKKGPEGALKAADKLGKLSGGNTSAQAVLDKMMSKQEWYSKASADMHNALNKDMYSLAIQSQTLEEIKKSGDVSHELGQNAVSNILKDADKAKSPKEAIAAAGQSKGAAKELANDEKMKQEVAKKSGVKAFTPLGWARLAAKTTGYVLNHGKDVIDALGAKKIAKNEDKNVIAEIRTQIENAEGSDKDYADSEFSIRFTTDDFKWHATCLDDRKMQVPEETLIKKVLNTDTGKKFKEFCIKKWKNIFNAKPDGDYALLPFILGNIDKFGLKSGNIEFFEKIKTVSDNMDKIESQFK